MPETIAESVDWIIDGMSLRERAIIANSDRDLFSLLKQLLAETLVVNDSIREKCLAKSDVKKLDDLEVETIIVDEIWEKLRETHKLRVVK